MKEDIKITNEFWVGVAVGVILMIIMITIVVLRIVTGYMPSWSGCIVGGLGAVVLMLGQRVVIWLKNKKSEAL